MGAPDPAFPTVQIDQAVEAGNLASLFFQLSAAVEQFRLDHPGLSQEEKDRLDAQSEDLEAKANAFNAEAIGDTLQTLHASLQNLKHVTSDAKHAISTLKTVDKVFSIANAAVALGVALASHDLASVGPCLTSLQQAASGGDNEASKSAAAGDSSDKSDAKSDDSA